MPGLLIECIPCPLLEAGKILLLLFICSACISSGNSTPLKNGCVRIFYAVILFYGSHLIISDMRLNPSGGQFGMTCANPIGGYEGNVKYFYEARMNPSGQSALDGVPNTEVIFVS